MGFNYYAYTTVGVRLKEEDLKEIKQCSKYKGCPHYPSIPRFELSRFCEQCGKKLEIVEWTEQEWKPFVKVFEEDKVPEEFASDYLVCMGVKFPSLNKTVYYEIKDTGEAGDEYYIGIHHCGDYRYGNVNDVFINLDAPEIIDCKLSLAFLLTPLGLWDKEKFGIYTWCEVR